VHQAAVAVVVVDRVVLGGTVVREGDGAGFSAEAARLERPCGEDGAGGRNVEAGQGGGGAGAETTVMQSNSQ